MKVAVIPARGGSTRIPRKNIKLFYGKPIIAWSIEKAISSKCFDKVIVSTNDNEIAEIARHYGAEAPFKRPESLSNNYIGTIPVVRHAIQWLKDNLYHPSYVCCIHATAPFIEVSDIEMCFTKLLENRSTYSFPVTSFPFPIQRALRLDSNLHPSMFDSKHLNTRSQDLEEAFHDAAQFWWGAADSWLNELPVYSPKSTTIKIPRIRTQDIDTIEDWESAEILFKILNSEINPLKN